MANKKYEFIEHTADIGVRAFGRNPEEVFINAAGGMFAIIAESRRIQPKETLEIAVQADGYDELLRQWLQELLYHYSVTGNVFTEFTIQEIGSDAIKAVVRGDKAPGKIKTEIKAVTYHGLKFRKVKDGYEAEVIFDV